MAINSLLHLGSNAILAQNAGIAVAGKNIANANTAGYQRELLDLRSTRGAPLEGGVRVVGPYRIETLFLARREQEAVGNHGAAGSAAQALAAAERAVGGATGSDLVDAIAALWGGITRVAAAPLDQSLRNQAVDAARKMTRVFQRVAGDLARTRADVDLRLGGMTAEATQHASEIARLNAAMVLDKDPVLADQRDLAAQKLAGLMGGQARIDPDGMMRFVVASGVVVVDGTRAAQVVLAPGAGPGGFGALQVVDGISVNDVTGKLTGGKMAGELRMRDVVGAQAKTDLDNLALSLSTAVNAQHAAGVGLIDATSRDLFVAAGGGPINASNLTLEAAIAANPRHLAAAAAGAGPDSGNNANALALAALRDAFAPGGGARTATDEAIRIIGAVGLAAANAASDEQVELARVESLAGVRDSLSGVSVEDEMTRMAAFRSASAASVNFVATVNELLRDMVEKL